MTSSKVQDMRFIGDQKPKKQSNRTFHSSMLGFGRIIRFILLLTRQSAKYLDTPTDVERFDRSRMALVLVVGSCFVPRHPFRNFVLCQKSDNTTRTLLVGVDNHQNQQPKKKNFFSPRVFALFTFTPRGPRTQFKSSLVLTAAQKLHRKNEGLKMGLFLSSDSDSFVWGIEWKI